MSVKKRGLKKYQKKLLSIPKKIEKGVRVQLKIEGPKLERLALSDHRYNRQSGQLDRAISSKVDKFGMLLSFFIDNRFITIKEGKHKGKSYGIFQHEGTGRGYRKSKGAKQYNANASKGGIRHDHFMDRAFKKGVPGIKKNIKKVIKKVIKG